MKKSKILQIILRMLQGFLVGLGAILPGVSGGTLCYVFGISNDAAFTCTVFGKFRACVRTCRTDIKYCFYPRAHTVFFGYANKRLKVDINIRFVLSTCVVDENIYPLKLRK